MLYCTAMRSESRSRSSIRVAAESLPELPLTHETRIKKMAERAATVANLRQANIWEKIQSIGPSRNQKRSCAGDRPIAAPLPCAVAQRRIRGRKATHCGLVDC